MIKELRDLSGIGQVERRGIYKQSLCKSTIHYFQVGDYMQKINYCIQDLNGEIPGLQQLTNKNVVYVFVRDSRYTKEFMDIGVDELSVSPQFVLTLRKHIRELD